MGVRRRRSTHWTPLRRAGSMGRDRSEEAVLEADFSYCARCGHALVVEELHGRPRPRCPECGHIVFLDPKVAAVVLVAIDGKLVLVRRAEEPAFGEWAFPAGYVDRGEAVEDAAVREVREETGLEVETTRLLGVYSRAGDPVVLAAYAAQVVGGALQAGDDVSEVALYEPDALPPLPFFHDAAILRAWRGV